MFRGETPAVAPSDGVSSDNHHPNIHECNPERTSFSRIPRCSRDLRERHCNVDSHLEHAARHDLVVRSLVLVSRRWRDVAYSTPSLWTVVTPRRSGSTDVALLCLSCAGKGPTCDWTSRQIGCVDAFSRGTATSNSPALATFLWQPLAWVSLLVVLASQRVSAPSPLHRNSPALQLQPTSQSPSP